ncbi:MAG: DUF1841 family protein [Methylophilaceae bacterium]
MSLFNPSRNEVREFFFATWTKFNSQLLLTEIEKIAINVIHMHPEYHEILNAPERFKMQDYFPEFGETNPFLHMSLHLSVLEQISINQPTGIANIYALLKNKHHNQHQAQGEHNAQHDILECLAETIWLAQRNNTGLDAEHYLQLLQQKAT